MNKKGFTLVELLATMAILAIISIIAIPNVIRIMDNNKKEKILGDAKSFIALAKYEVARDTSLRNSLDNGSQRLTLRRIDLNNDVLNDANNAAYNRDNSYVDISKNNDTIQYCVYLISENYKVSYNDNCVSETYLLGDNPKNYVNEIEN